MVISSRECVREREWKGQRASASAWIRDIYVCEDEVVVDDEVVVAPNSFQGM
jgi:hypothetical protein